MARNYPSVVSSQKTGNDVVSKLSTGLVHTVVLEFCDASACAGSTCWLRGAGGGAGCDWCGGSDGCRGWSDGGR